MVETIMDVSPYGIEVVATGERTELSILREIRAAFPQRSAQ